MKCLVALMVVALSLPGPASAADALTWAINHERLERDRARLVYDSDWQACADRAARRFRHQGYIEHPTNCAQMIANRYGEAGENLAMSWSDRRVFRAWMHSESHRDVMLSPKWGHVTIGRAKDKAGYIYYVALFHA